MKETKFICIATQYKDTIYRVAFNYFKNPHDAEDAVQDVLLKLYTSKKDFESDDYIRNWIIRITINHCKNILRMPWRRRNITLDDVTEYNLVYTESENELLTEVLQLSEKYRLIIYLFYYEGYSAKEIAELLHLSESVVTTRLSRGRRQLKLKLREV